MTSKFRQAATNDVAEGGSPAEPATVSATSHLTTRSPLAVSVPEGARIIGVSRSLAYELMANGELPFVCLGKRRLLLISDLARLLQRHRCGGSSL